MNDIEFVDGLTVKAPRDGAPDFVKATVSIRREAMIAWLQAHEGEWINADVKVSRGGKWYVAVNAWKPKDPRDGAPPPPRKAQDHDDAFVDDDIPF